MTPVYGLKALIIKLSPVIVDKWTAIFSLCTSRITIEYCWSINQSVIY